MNKESITKIRLNISQDYLEEAINNLNALSNNLLSEDKKQILLFSNRYYSLLKQKSLLDNSEYLIMKNNLINDILSLVLNFEKNLNTSNTVIDNRDSLNETTVEGDKNIINNEFRNNSGNIIFNL